MAKYKVTISGIDTNKLKVLSNQQIIDYIQAYKTGDESAYEELILGNLRLVLSVIQRFADRHNNLDDLFQIGCVGLIKSIQNFDLSHNVRFSTYAVPMISGEIKRFLRDNTPIKVSRQLKDLAYLSLKAKEEFLIRNQREPNNEEIGTLVGVDKKLIDEAMESVQSVGSLYDPVYEEDGEPLYLIDQIRYEADFVDKISDMLSLKKGIDNLDILQKKIINDRYYLDRTQAEIAEDFGISQAQVSRLEKNAIEVLKRYF